MSNDSQHPTLDFLRGSLLSKVQDAFRPSRPAGAPFPVIDGVTPGALSFLAFLLQQVIPKGGVLVAVTATVKAQETFQQDLETWMHRLANDAPPTAAAVAQPVPLYYPAWEVLPHDTKLPHADVISERLECLVRLNSRGGAGTVAPRFVVTTVTGLMQPTFRPDQLRGWTRVLRRGDRCDPSDLVASLEALAYDAEAQVTQKGEMSLRGGILDLFPLTSPWPVRLEFFGDELESLRFFDPHTQVSRESVESVVIPPAGELGLLRQETEEAMDHAGLWDFLPPKSLVLLPEPSSLEHEVLHYAQQIPEGNRLFHTWDRVVAGFQEQGAAILGVREGDAVVADVPGERAIGGLVGAGEFDGLGVEGSPQRTVVRFDSLDAYRPVVDRLPEPEVAARQRRDFFEQIHRWMRQGFSVWVFCNNEGEQQRFEEIWREYGLAPLASGREPAREASKLAVHLGALSRGFICEGARLVVVTDAEIFGRYRAQRPRRLKSAHAAAARSALTIDFTDLEEGDYVVHLQHGIGRFVGLQLLPTAIRGGSHGHRDPQRSKTDGQECLVIEYAPRRPDQEPPKLFVPVSESHLISKYIGAGKASPPLNTLGGARWTKAKEQAEKSVQDFASRLLAIQANRAAEEGIASGEDTPWQREFEAAFLYEETPDQLSAIEDTKRDMESSRPMDRLVCGDVGFGKTEVAVRAAFKAVMDGRQVAILVPTTVLAHQHYNTFRERMADYPVRTELLSRFRTRSQQQRSIQDAASGAVDILVGTHRLLSKDVAFKNLGLVVVDEEQRFGVAHKEKLKELRQLVDVLTLTATPIPRTLYLALMGARDMSTIETPPQDRLPVETIVTAYDERIIRDAVRREMNRGGQVFFLHNRVLSIATVAQRLQALVPDARIVVGHGQMDSDDLEQVMTQFISGQADVLISTTIIESGIDIPNANTIIIDRADRFGLSDLYQLRGRVGRYKHQAFAYFLIPRHAALLSDARKRISAIKQYSTLGSGFKIAMRDLEIRGAGNLLGAEQSGHITAVGFDLYCQLLKQSVSALKGEVVKPRLEVVVRLDFLISQPGDPRNPELGSSQTALAWLPVDYILEPRQRIEIYRKLAQVTEAPDVERLREEVIDRFGRLPPAVELLFLVAELKLLAADRCVTGIETQNDKLMLTRNGEYLTLGGRFPRMLKKQPKAKLNEIRRLLLAL